MGHRRTSCERYSPRKADSFGHDCGYENISFGPNRIVTCRLPLVLEWSRVRHVCDRFGVEGGLCT